MSELAGSSSAAPQQERQERRLTIPEAARRLKLSHQSVRNYVERGWIRAEPSKEDPNTKVIAESHLRSAKVLRRTDVVKAHKISEAKLDEALDRGTIAAGPDNRLSLDDIDELRGVKASRAEPEAGAVSPPPSGERAPAGVDYPVEPASERRDRRAALRTYHSQHQSPCDLPDWFWDTPDCPPFEAPTNVAAFRYGVIVRTGEAEVSTQIIRSAGWFQPTDASVPHYEVEGVWGYEPGRHVEGAAPPRLALANRNYALAKQEWEREWVQRSRYAPEDGRIAPVHVERRDRRAILDHYRRHDLSPCDLPDWFWDTDECPEFEPPTNVFRYTCSEEVAAEEIPSNAVLFESGRAFWVRRSAGWERLEGHSFPTMYEAKPQCDLAAVETVIDGEPDEYARENWEYRRAEQEWRLEWERRRRKRESSGG